MTTCKRRRLQDLHCPIRVRYVASASQSEQVNGEGTQRDEVLARCNEVASVYEFVEILLRKNGWGSYGHQILAAVELLHDPVILKEEQERIKFVLIDEFQDSNFGQIELAQLLSGNPQNVFAVGDPDQAIYRFRGATSEVLRRIQTAGSPRLRRPFSTKNFRSVPSVLETAYAVISRNDWPDRKPLVSGRELQAKAESQAAADIFRRRSPSPPRTRLPKRRQWLMQLRSGKKETGVPWSEFAILIDA